VAQASTNFLLSEGAGLIAQVMSPTGEERAAR
jgi:hypothetical protein